MKSTDQRVSRKKLTSKDYTQNYGDSIPSPNLRYHFLFNEPGHILKQLRKVQIDQILSFISGRISLFREKSKRQKIKKILLLLGPSGTGKSSCIKSAFKQLLQLCKKTSETDNYIKSIRLLSFNAYSLRKCSDIQAALSKIAQQNEKDKLMKVEEGLMSKDGEIILNIVCIEEIEQIIEHNNSQALEQFGKFLLEREKVGENEEAKKNRYVVIGISNSIKQDQNIKKKLLGYQILVAIFEPYSQEKLLKIAYSKINQIQQKLDIKIKLTERLMKYLIMKLSENKRDDTRFVVQIIKQILFFAQSKNYLQTKKNEGKIEIQITLQQLNNIGKVRGMLSSSKSQIIKKLNFKQQMILIILYNHMKSTQSLDMPFLQVVNQFQKIQQSLGINIYEDVRNAVSELETYGCIEMRTQSKSKSKSKVKSNSTKSDNVSKLVILLKLSLNDIENTLSQNPALSHYFNQN